MKIGVIVASSNCAKNELLYNAVCKAAKKDDEVINFGVFDDTENFSYVEISLVIGMFLNRKIVDFVVTGCSSGQGMMLACNNMPGVICGYAPTPQDAFLFAHINDGNAVSLPLGLNFGWCGELNLQNTLNALFDGDFGSGYPEKDAERKRHDTALLKEIKNLSNVSFEELLGKLDKNIVEKAEKFLKNCKIR